MDKRGLKMLTRLSTGNGAGDHGVEDHGAGAVAVAECGARVGADAGAVVIPITRARATTNSGFI